MPLPLPSRPHLDQLRKQAKDLLAAWRAGDAEALSSLREHHPEYSQGTAPAEDLRLADAQLVTARRYGFASWPRLKEEVELANLAFADRVKHFVCAATEESTGPVEGPFLLAKRMLARDPALAKADVYTALVLGDADAVRRQVQRDADWVRRKGGPQPRRELLLYVAYSKFHRESPEIAEGLLATARLLLDAGANPDATFVNDQWDSPLGALLGACGVANFPAMAGLLLGRGATIDDHESLYHSTEHADTRCLELLLARGANPKGTNALNHALDFPGLERTRLLLDHGANPNEVLGHNGTSFHIAIAKGRELALLKLLVEHGADVHARRPDGRSPYQVAMQQGHHEAAAYLAELGAATEVTPYERFADACGRGDLTAARQVIEENPRLLENLSTWDRRAFVQLGAQGKTATLAAMIDSGLPVSSRGDHGQTALHWACWHGWRETAAALLERGADVAARENEFGATPLGWAVHGCDNYPNRQGDYPGVVCLLLAAGAEVKVIERLPDDLAVADLLRAAGVKDAPEE
ncbi:MAG TPA: ankyrin repeat domain-containing protein [Thermoanaerobaculia bacterium]|jgi:ankyrin repeat protein|nr:ankyrin repeat domain-containing protein [Thermoanaerobaculia bacterium]